MKNEPLIILFGALVVCGVGLVAAFGIPVYRVWQQGKSGEATLREAEFSRQIKVQEAKAKLESAKLEAEAEVERARGVAKANEIIGTGLEGKDAYLRYLWITGLNNGSKPEVIYVPTEASLPILEANRLRGGNCAEESKPSSKRK